MTACVNETLIYEYSIIYDLCDVMCVETNIRVCQRINISQNVKKILPPAQKFV